MAGVYHTANKALTKQEFGGKCENTKLEALRQLVSMIFFLSQQFRREVVHSLNDNVLVKIKQMGLSCYTMV